MVQQIKKEDSLIKAATSPPSFSLNTNQDNDSFAATLGLKPDFLRNLVDELRLPVTHMKTTISLLESKHQ